MNSLPNIGDRVSLFYPGSWKRFGRVINTDYHPFGVDDSVQIEFDKDIIGVSRLEWWDTRYVKVENKQNEQSTTS